MKKVLSLVVMLAIVFTMIPPGPKVEAATSTFSDTANHWARNSIELGANLDLVKGVGNNKYSPNSPVTREAFTTLVVRAAGQERVSGISFPDYSPFSDVASDRWSAKDIKMATTLGWIVQSDYDNFMFKPSQNLTREEAASFLRALLFGQKEELSEVKSSAVFSDINQVSDRHKDDVILLAQLGIIQGNNGYFKPKDTLTRAESITLILRALSYQSNILAYIANIENRHNVAMGYATSAFILSPNPNSTAQFASAMMGEGYYEKAEELFNASIKEGYDNPYVYSNLALAAYYQNDFADAIEYQRKLLGHTPTDPFQLFLLAQYEGMNGNYKEALSVAEDAKKYDTEGLFTSDIDDFMALVTDLHTGKSDMSHKEVQVLFWKSVSDWIDKHADIIQTVAAVTAFVPVVGQVTAVALNTVVVGNTVARAIADPSKDVFADLAEDALGAMGGAGLKYAGKVVAKGIGNAMTSKTINDRVMNQVIKEGDWDELTNLQKYEDSLNSYISTGRDIQRSIKNTEKAVDFLESIDDAVNPALDIFNDWKSIGDSVTPYEPAPVVANNAFTPWIGTWTFNELYLGTGDIIISKVTATAVTFKHTTVGRTGHTGELEGTATIKGNTAVLNTGEKDMWSDSMCVVTLVASAEKLEVKAPNCAFFHGLNGFIGGTFYKDGGPKVLNEDILASIKKTSIKKEHYDFIISKLPIVTELSVNYDEKAEGIRVLYCTATEGWTAPFALITIDSAGEVRVQMTYDDIDTTHTDFLLWTYESKNAPNSDTAWSTLRFLTEEGYEFFYD